MPAFKVQIGTRRFKSQNYSVKSVLTNGQPCANYRRITVVKLSPCQQRALLRLRPSQQTATFYGIGPTHSFRFVIKSDTARLLQLAFRAGKDGRPSERLQLPSPVSWIHSTSPSCAFPPSLNHRAAVTLLNIVSISVTHLYSRASRRV